MGSPQSKVNSTSTPEADHPTPRFREHPEEAFTPFQESERQLLRRYVQQAEDLQRCGFFERGEKLQVTIFNKKEKEGSNLNYPGEDMLRSLLMVLRTFYAPREPANFNVIRNMLARHAKDREGPVAAAALGELRDYKTGAQKVFARSPIVMQEELTDAAGNVESRIISAKSIFEDYLYGGYFHRQEDRLQRIERWETMPIPKFIFIQSATALANVYVHFAGLVSAILSEPSLIEHGTD